MKQYYTKAEAAYALGVSYQRISQVIKAGHLHADYVGLTKYYRRIKRSELVRYATMCGKTLREVE